MRRGLRVVLLVVLHIHHRDGVLGKGHGLVVHLLVADGMLRLPGCNMDYRSDFSQSECDKNLTTVLRHALAF